MTTMKVTPTNLRTLRSRMPEHDPSAGAVVVDGAVVGEIGGVVVMAIKVEAEVPAAAAAGDPAAGLAGPPDGPLLPDDGNRLCQR